MQEQSKNSLGHIEAWFDGCCEPVNPGGHASYGVLVKYNGAVVFEEGQHVGSGKGMSNNVAEYCGCLAVLKQIRRMLDQGCPLIKRITIYGDSKLVIMQLSRRWKVHQGAYVPYYREAIERLKELIDPRLPNIKFIWIPREQNSECDRLSKGELIKRGVEFRIQPEAVL